MERRGIWHNGEFGFIKMGRKGFKQVTYMIRPACETSPSPECVEFDFVLAENGRENIQIFFAILLAINENT